MPEPNLLVSGPAGSGKSQRVRELINESETPTVAADFQSLTVALTQVVRAPVTGKYPERSPDLMPLTEYVRRAVITGATARGIRVIATNSDGDPDRRGFLLDQLGENSQEVVVDPGQLIAEDRLKNPGATELSAECRQALNRWYTRHYRENPRRPSRR